MDTSRTAAGTATSAASPSPLDAFLAERLNLAQREAVTAPDGPLLILAGAGSGKTRVIAYRIAYLVMERRVPPDQILAVTFTNKAAGEMKERVGQLIGPAGRQVMLGTFHSICARLLRRDIARIGYSPSFSIYDDGDQLALLKRLYADAGINPKQHAPQAVRAAISRAKEQLQTPQHFSRMADSPFEIAAAALYRRYQDALQEQNALDFDDLIVLVLRLFDEAPDVLARYQRQFRHILVDEYQDVNHAQYLLIKHLAAQHRNLTIVGDDSQAIYGWRGADVRYILEFEHDFPESRVVRLEQNYRSTKTILSAAQQIERGLRARREKQLWTENEEGGPITLCQAIDEHDEAAFVTREIERLRTEGFSFGEVAVMYRMNAQSRALEEAFVRRRLPYQLIGGTRFYERREIKDILAYMRLVNNSADAVSLERIINVPNRGIGEKTLEELRDWASLLGVSAGHALRLLRQAEDGHEEQPQVAPPFGSRSRAQLLAFAKLLYDLTEAGQSNGLVELFDTIVLRTGYREYLATDKASEERWENVMELRTVISQYAGLEPGTGLRAFLENVSLVSDVDTLKDEQNAVTLLTLHAAKGLEFPVVFITGMEEGIFPHSRALEEDDLDEERRLCYVGMTRAMKRLYLVHCERRTVYGFPREADPSRFLGVLPMSQLHVVNSHGLPPSAFGGAVRAWQGGSTAIGQTAAGPRKRFGSLSTSGTTPGALKAAHPLLRT
ncbi:MAG TPA: UvrD-helicase domain-containing protein, partial [Chloroflexota bacterium]|nr:UvrD-helicase domain-containing protein [Chloroflexota bacterium]